MASSAKTFSRWAMRENRKQQELTKKNRENTVRGITAEFRQRKKDRNELYNACPYTKTSAVMSASNCELFFVPSVCLVPFRPPWSFWLRPSVCSPAVWSLRISTLRCCPLVCRWWVWGMVWVCAAVVLSAVRRDWDRRVRHPEHEWTRRASDRRSWRS